MYLNHWIIESNTKCPTLDNLGNGPVIMFNSVSKLKCNLIIFMFIQSRKVMWKGEVKIQLENLYFRAVLIIMQLQFDLPKSTSEPIQYFIKVNLMEMQYKDIGDFTQVQKMDNSKYGCNDLLLFHKFYNLLITNNKSNQIKQ